MVLVANMSSSFAWFNAGFGILALAALLGAAIVFPMLSLFQVGTVEAVKNSLILGLANLPRAAVIALLWCLPVIMLFRVPVVFFYIGFLWVTVYFSAAAYLSSRLLRQVFARFLPEDFDGDDEE